MLIGKEYQHINRNDFTSQRLQRAIEG